LWPYRHLLPSDCFYTAVDQPTLAREFNYSSEPIIAADACRLPVKDAVCDLVFHTEVIEHIWDYRAFLTECRRVTKPGGRLVFTLPFAARWHYLPHDFWRFTRSALEKLCYEAGFNRVTVRPRGTDINVFCYKFVSIAYRWIISIWHQPRWLGLPGVFVLMTGLVIPVMLVATLNALCFWFETGSSNDPLGYTVYAWRVK